MWPLRSIGYRTDLFLVGFDGVVDDRQRYLVVRTPSNPDFWWGNFLLYPEPPHADAVALWQEDLAREFPNASAKLLAWDRPDGATGEVELFVKAGFVVDESAILTVARASLVPPPRLAGDVEVRRVASDREWSDASNALVAAFAPRRSGTLEDLRLFVERQITRYRSFQARGLGQWFGAYVGGEIAGALGVVTDGEIGRYQLVGTDPLFSRRGVCSTLVYGAAKIALGELGVSTLVMAADAEYHAAKVYESVGFTTTERLVALIAKPPRA